MPAALKPRKKGRRLRVGLTLDQYESLLEAQSGGCAICGRPPKTRRLDVDHDHRTGDIRGLLCHTHNRVLWAGATSAALRRMADYLDRTGLDQSPEWRRQLDEINRKDDDALRAN